MREINNNLLWFTWVLIVSASGCGTHEDVTQTSSGAKGSAPAATRRSGSAIDLTEVVQTANQKFRRQEGRLAAEGTNHSLSVESNGVVLQTKRRSGVAGRGAAALRAVRAATTKKAFLQARTALAAPSVAPAALALKTLSVARDGYECIGATRQLRVSKEGAAQVDHGSCREHWKNGSKVAEQSFFFDARPIGKGDLTVRIQVGVDGELPRLNRADREGLHFSGHAGEAYRYGHGKWVDASGATVPITARYSGGNIELIVPSAVVEKSSYPAVLDPEVGPEIGTDKPVAVPTTLGYYPSLASDGNGFFSVQTINDRIRGTRVDANGGLEELRWLDFGTDNTSQFNPAVAYGAGNYFVIWSESGSDEVITLRGRLARPDGTLVGSSNFIVAEGEGLNPSVAWDGNHFVASWLRLGTDSTPSSIRFALFDSEGAMVTGSETVISATEHSTNPHIAVGSSHTFVTWEEWQENGGWAYDIYGKRVDKQGHVTDVESRLLSLGNGGNADSAVASSGSRFLVAWNTVESNYAVYGTLVDTATGTLIARNFPLSRSPADATTPTIDFDGTNFLVAWADGRNNNTIFGVHVSPSGELLEAVDQPLSLGGLRYLSAISSDRVNLAYNGSRHLVSFVGEGIEGSLFNSDFSTVKGRVPLSALPNNQGYPRMVWDGTNYVVAWTDERDSTSAMTVRAIRISAAGTVLDPDGVVVTPPQTTAFDVTLASMGKGSSQVLYFNGGDIPSQRTFFSDATLSDPSPIGDAILWRTPSFESNGTTYLATYQLGDWGNGSVNGRLLDQNGVSGPAFRIDDSTDNIGSSAVPIPGGYFLSYSNAGTHVVTVSDTGVVGASSLLTTEVTQATGATSGQESLITWADYSDLRIYGRFFEAGVWKGDSFVVAEHSSGWSPAVAWDGSSYLVVWDTEDRLLRSRNVARDGTLGPIEVIVAEDCTGPVLASDGTGNLLLSYVKWTEYSSSRRIYSRLLTPEGSGVGGATGQGGASAGGTSSIETTLAVGGNSAVASSAGGTSSIETSLAVGGNSAVASSAGRTSSVETTIAIAGMGGVSATSSSSTAAGGVPIQLSCSVPSSEPRAGAWGLYALLGVVALRLRRCRRTGKSDSRAG
jgi:hypothetical protein